VAAVASRDGTRARAYADAHGIPGAHAGYDALLADEAIDVVYVSTPNSLHLPWVRRALQAGKHVLCEKPMGRSRAEVRDAFALAQRHGLVLAEAFMYRHHPQTARVRRLIGEGAIGRLRLIRASFGFRQPDAPDPRLSTELQGGGLMDVGCYCVSVARWLAGEPGRACAGQLLGGDGVDVVMAGLLEHPDGVLTHFDCGLALADRSDLEVVGETGTLWVDDPFHCRRPGIVVRAEGQPAREVEIHPVDHYALQAADIVRAIRTGEGPRVGASDAIAQAAVIEALYASTDAGRWVDVQVASTRAPG
jgi:xylose dehydrogenase (NAD/NADP)